MRISDKKREKISEQILAYLFSINPRPEFTNKIAQEIIRDEEFTKKLLLVLKKKDFVIEVKKNPQGTPYLKRSRWRLNPKIYKIYSERQQ